MSKIYKLSYKDMSKIYVSIMFLFQSFLEDILGGC